MAATGGRTPFDQSGALTGPARVVYAPITEPAPVDAWDIVSPVNVSGEYPLEGAWKDFGLASDAPVYNHAKTVTGIEYQQPKQALFEQIASITRTFTASVAEITADNLTIVENSNGKEAIAAAAGKSAQTKVPFGLYSEFKTYRVAMISYRPGGSTVVTEVDGTVRPAAVVLVLPIVRLSANNSQFTFDKGNPVAGAIEFAVFPDSTQDPNEEHGYWIFETPGTIA